MKVFKQETIAAWRVPVQRLLLGALAVLCLGLAVLHVADAPVAAHADDAPGALMTQSEGGLAALERQLYLLFAFVLAIFLGFELISKVPSQLHTPLMSGANAISGITIVGALILAGLTESGLIVKVLGFLAVVTASINVVGGYLVTNRMLGMFTHKGGAGS